MQQTLARRAILRTLYHCTLARCCLGGTSIETSSKWLFDAVHEVFNRQTPDTPGYRCSGSFPGCRKAGVIHRSRWAPWISMLLMYVTSDSRAIFSSKLDQKSRLDCADLVVVVSL